MPRALRYDGHVIRDTHDNDALAETDTQRSSLREFTGDRVALKLGRGRG